MPFIPCVLSSARCHHFIYIVLVLIAVITTNAESTQCMQTATCHGANKTHRDTTSHKYTHRHTTHNRNNTALYTSHFTEILPWNTYTQNTWKHLLSMASWTLCYIHTYFDRSGRIQWLNIFQMNLIQPTPCPTSSSPRPQKNSSTISQKEITTDY